MDDAGFHTHLSENGFENREDLKNTQEERNTNFTWNDHIEDEIFRTLHTYGISTDGIRKLLKDDVVEFSKTIVERYYSVPRPSTTISTKDKSHSKRKELCSVETLDSEHSRANGVIKGSISPSSEESPSIGTHMDKKQKIGEHAFDLDNVAIVNEHNPEPFAPNDYVQLSSDPGHAELLKDRNVIVDTVFICEEHNECLYYDSCSTDHPITDLQSGICEEVEIASGSGRSVTDFETSTDGRPDNFVVDGDVESENHMEADNPVDEEMDRIYKTMEDLTYLNNPNMSILKECTDDKLKKLNIAIKEFFDRENDILRSLYVTHVCLWNRISISDSLSMGKMLDYLKRINLVDPLDDLKIMDLYSVVLDRLTLFIDKFPILDSLKYLDTILFVFYNSTCIKHEIGSKMLKITVLIINRCEVQNCRDILFGIAKNSRRLSDENVGFFATIISYSIQHLLSRKPTAESYSDMKNLLENYLDLSFFNSNDSMIDNFKGFKCLFGRMCNDIKFPKIVSTPFIISVFSTAFIKKYYSKNTASHIRQLCLKLCSMAATHIMPIFHDINENYTEIIGEYVKYFSGKPVGLFKLNVVSLKNDSGSNKANKLMVDDIKHYALQYLSHVNSNKISRSSCDICHCIFYLALKWHSFLANLQEPFEVLRFCKLFEFLFENTNSFQHKFENIIEDINIVSIFSGNVQFYGDEETEVAWKILKYHVLNELYESIWKLMMDVLYTSSENILLKTAITFVSRMVSNELSYLSLPSIKDLLVASMGDYSIYVREQAIKVYFTFMVSDPSNFKECITESVTKRLLLCTKDVNWRIRLYSINILHMYLSLEKSLESLEIISSIAEHTSDFDREHQSVRNAYINLLASSFFVFNHDNFLDSCNGKMDLKKVKVGEKFVKIILYKMGAYKGKINPIAIMVNNLKKNFKCILDPILYFSGTKNLLLGTDRTLLNECLSLSGKGSKSTVLTDTINAYMDSVVGKWLNVLLDLFLFKRSQGATYHELAEVLCITKLVGEVNPKLFTTHLIYFLPYLRVDSETTLDYDRINIIILVANLASIVSNSMNKDNCDENMLRDIDSSVHTLVDYESPALTRAIIQLLSSNAKVASYGFDEWVKPIFTSTFSHLTNIKNMFENSKENMHMISSGNILKYAWKLACISEFVDFMKYQLSGLSNLSNRVFELFVDLSLLYNDLKLWNVSGMFVQCVARLMMNTDNLRAIVPNALKNMLCKVHSCSFIHKCTINSGMMLLYQLLLSYKTLSNDSGLEDHVSTLFTITNLFIRTFSSIISQTYSLYTENSLAYEDKQNGDVKHAPITEIISPDASETHIDKVMAMEIIGVILVNRLTHPELLLPFIFVHMISDDLNMQRLAEHSLKLIIKQDVGIFLNKLSACFQTLLIGIVENFFKSCSTSILGSSTHGIVRVYLEDLEAKRKNSQKFIKALLAQTMVIFDEDFKLRTMSLIRSKGNWAYVRENLESNCSKATNIKRMVRDLLCKIKDNIDEEECNGFAFKYFSCLYINLVTTILDKLPVRDRRESQFIISSVRSVVDSNIQVTDDHKDLVKFRNQQLTQFSNKIKRIYK